MTTADSQVCVSVLCFIFIYLLSYVLIILYIILQRYFETCHFLSTELSPIERIERDAKFAACKIQEEGSMF